ncbi:ABC transporter substrate-binding protein [Oscillospiraceae bacterium PP1C4]
MKKLLSLALAAAFALSFSVPALAQVTVEDEAYYTRFKGQSMSINVHNWGEYISDGSDDSMNVISEFEELTGIKVNYTTFATNEELYARLKSGGAAYDVVIPSDYTIARMIREDMLLPLDLSHIPNFKYVSKDFINPLYDLQGKYSVPYTWGTVGVIYNKTMVDEEDLGSWNLLWNEKYLGEILMFSNPRDAFAISLTRLGYSMNPQKESELREATEALKDQKLLVQAYVMDEIFDKMLGGEAAVAPYYAGDAITMMDENEDLGYFVPAEGTNRFVDAAVIPKGAKNKECAEMFINFLLEPEVGAANAEYIGYSSPNDGALAQMDEEITSNEVAYPPKEVIEKTEFFVELPPEMSLLMDRMWTEVLSSDEQYSKWLIPMMVLAAIVASVTINVLRTRRKRRDREYAGNYPIKRL